MMTVRRVEWHALRAETIPVDSSIPFLSEQQSRVRCSSSSVQDRYAAHLSQTARGPHQPCMTRHASGVHRPIESTKNEWYGGRTLRCRTCLMLLLLLNNTSTHATITTGRVAFRVPPDDRDIDGNGTSVRVADLKIRYGAPGHRIANSTLLANDETSTATKRLNAW